MHVWMVSLTGHGLMEIQGLCGTARDNDGMTTSALQASPAVRPRSNRQGIPASVVLINARTPQNQQYATASHMVPIDDSRCEHMMATRTTHRAVKYKTEMASN
jgi:hypothetical protein